MCGFFIHGRTWVNWEQEVTEEGMRPGELLFVDGRAAGKTSRAMAHYRDISRLNVIDTFCAPMTVNGHHLMPDAPSKGHGKRLGEIAVRVTSMDLKYGGNVDTNAVATRLSRRKYLDSYVVAKDVRQDNKTGDMTYLYHAYQGKPGRNSTVVDWGLDPANGRFVPKCGNTMGPLSEVATDAKAYMLQGMSELVRWCENHWGRLNDKEEFISDAPSCLDYEKLRVDLPGMVRPFNTRSDEAIFKHDTYLQHNSNEYLSAVIAHADSPRDRFIEMFKQAPSEYWRGIEAKGGRQWKPQPDPVRREYKQKGAPATWV